MSNKLRLETLGELEKALWDEFVYSTNQANIFSTYDWLRLNSRGKNSHIIAILNGNKIVAGIGLLENEKKVEPPPFSNLNTILLNESSTKSYENDSLRIKVQEMLIHYLETNFSSVKIINHPSYNDIRVFQWKGWKEQVRSTYYLTLDNIVKNSQNFRDSTKRQIKKLERFNYSFETSADFEEFYNLATRSFERQKARIFLDKTSFFEIFKFYRDRDQAVLFFLNYDSCPVAANLFINDKNKMSYYFGAGVEPAYLEKGAPSILLYKSFKELENRGIKTVDFGGAHHRTIARFKANFNPYLVTLFQVSFDKSG